MAERRMFHASVVESDAFLDLPIGAQALYFHLGMQADDDGFLNCPKQIARKLRRPAKELQLLIDTGFLLDFDGIVVLRHWRVANFWKSDRVTLPNYPELAKKLYLKPNREYTQTRIPKSQNLLQLKKNMLLGAGTRLDSQYNRKEENRKEKKINENKSEEVSLEQPAPVPEDPLLALWHRKRQALEKEAEYVDLSL